MPYPSRYYHRRPKQWGRRARMELVVTVIVIVVVIAAILIFLLVYHDLPLRIGEPT